MRTKLSRGAAIIAVTMAVAVILLLEGYLLWQVRSAAWQSAIRSADNVLSALSANIERNLNIVDLSLAGVQEAMERFDLSDVEPKLRNMALFDRAGSAEYLGSMLVLSPTGDVVYDSNGFPPRAANFADRDYFDFHREWHGITYLSGPFASRLRADDPSIALSRRLTGPDGSFQGVVIGVIRLAYFSSLFSRVKLGSSAVISLVRTDGQMLMRVPTTDGKGNIGLDLSNSPVFQAMNTGPVQPFTAKAQIDGVTRHYIYSRIGSYPIILSVAFSIDDVFESWFSEAITIFGTGVVICIIIMVLFFWLLRALDRQVQVEGDLARLATTDVLTGLSNRRHFDDVLAREWSRTARESYSLSLLIVDVDHFKAVNDGFGHAAGDTLLRAVAHVIVGALLRPADIASRYGGDEFAVLLPGTEQGGALVIAERIRAGIDGLQLEDGQGGTFKVTVSIGLGTVHVPPETYIGVLFRKADRALYQAKDAGRNSVAVVT